MALVYIAAVLLIIATPIVIWDIARTVIRTIRQSRERKEQPDGIIIKYSGEYALVAFEREDSEECNFSWAFNRTRDVLSSYNKENIFYLNLSDNSICKRICNGVFQSISSTSTVLNGFIMNEDTTTSKTYLIRILLPDNKSVVFNFKTKFIDQ